MTRGWALLTLLLRFVRAVAVSGVQTLRVIAQVGLRGEVLKSTYVRIGYTAMSERGAVALACLCSLTPGTTAVDLDAERRELVLHVLDARTADAVVAVIRREFEPGLVRLFGGPA